MSTCKIYRKTYNELGEERVQIVPLKLSTAIDSTNKADKSSEYDQYWDARKDWDWIDVPGHIKWNRKTRKKEFKESITRILMDLEPASAFDPSVVWKAELEKIQRANNMVELTQNSKGKVKTTQKIKEDNSLRKDLDDTAAEIRRIRMAVHNSGKKELEKKLMKMFQELSIPKARIVLLIEILSHAYNEIYSKNSRDKKLLFDVLWAIDAAGDEITNFKMPKVEIDEISRKPMRLVYDDFNVVQTLIKTARSIRAKESDIIKLQLLDMSDCLPPLSKFTHGFKLDAWQKQALTWIDSGKSVVICAPTSSGKTVLSSYVAVIFKREVEEAAIADGNAKLVVDENPEDDDDDNHNEEDGENTDRIENDDNNAGDEYEALERRLQSEQRQTDASDPVTPHLIAMAKRTEAEEKLARMETRRLVEEDRLLRNKFRQTRVELQSTRQEMQRVLFVVPSDPLVWQVAAYFSKLLRGEGDTETKVAIVTAQLTFNPHGNPPKHDSFQKMPQIVVGTPLALEAAFTKARGIAGALEVSGKSSGVLLPGGFDHFDWVIYDEVHSLDGADGDALQRLIRSMNCKFLALSATVGNAEQLRSWMEKVKGDQLNGVEVLNIKEPNPTSSTTSSQLSTQSNPAEVMYLHHQVRFINLQRYLWNNVTKKIQPISPIAAIDSVEALRAGFLDKSTLSFTSHDSYRLWEQIKKFYPRNDPDVACLDPHSFFKTDVRITLQATKEYEDQLKKGLKVLATKFPIETQELLYSSQITDLPSKEFNLCELIFDLAANEMLPCLPFHLNTFEAIKLFQHLLAGLEWRQKRDFPNYYMDLRSAHEEKVKSNKKIEKNAGKNEKEAEEMKRHGEISDDVFDVDPYAPHPSYVFSIGAPLSGKEMEEICHEMEMTDGFEKRDTAAVRDRRGQNDVILRHALIRGLRRGIGLFINEVSFPSYRRAVQKYASKGRLAVVISDDSLAFGVNMPFRTCIFCGEMNGTLDELMAQQMSGRAGRRGLDTQGNLVYAGIKLSHIRRLMIGTVSNITGAKREPRYETLFLQGFLSPRHVGWHRADIIGGQTLNEFIEGIPAPEHSYTMGVSKQAIIELGFIVEDRQDVAEITEVQVTKTLKGFKLNEENRITYSLLTLMWEIRSAVHESISIGLLFNEILREFDPIIANIPFTERRQNAEQMEQYIFRFCTILLVIFDRTPYMGEGFIKMTECTYFQNLLNLEFYNRWQDIFANMQSNIPDQWQALRDPCVPYTELDGTVFQCIHDRNYIYSLSGQVKQLIKEKLWHIGNVLKTLTNQTWCEPDYFRLQYFILRTSFKKLKYLNSEIIHKVVHFEDISASYYEGKQDAGKAIKQTELSKPWKDNDEVETSTILPNPWFLAIQSAIQRYKETLQQLQTASTTTNTDIKKTLAQELLNIVSIFTVLKPSDRMLIECIADKKYTDKVLLCRAISNCSYVDSNRGDKPMLVISVLVWICLKLVPSLGLKSFLIYFRTIYDCTVDQVGEEFCISEEEVRRWYQMSNSDLLQLVPTSVVFSNEKLMKSMTSNNGMSPEKSADAVVGVLTPSDIVTEGEINLLKQNCKMFIEWLDQAEDDDDDDEEEEEEGDEES